ncbi:hypothetical protein [Microbacterium sp. LWH3-1.2]|uniref:hypothetical protein n=1 Tax=Microbacterium sp. LWH3-1.2 TaxID=3135256 RepID=UPI00341FB88B
MHTSREKLGTEVSGTVATPVTLIYRLPDKVPHASFGISRDGRLAYAVHVTGSLAQRARTAVAKGDRVTITAGRLRPRGDAVAIVDLEAEALTVDLGR